MGGLRFTAINDGALGVMAKGTHSGSLRDTNVPVLSFEVRKCITNPHTQT